MVLAALKDAISSENLSFKVINTDSQSNYPAAIDIYQNQLDELAKKEKRIKMAYMDGIDTIEEYRKNKELLLEERNSIESRINALPKPAAKSDTTAALYADTQ